MRHRALTCSLLALAALPVAALAQTAPPGSTPAGPPCFEMFAADANTLPGSPMLINKCTGQTYVLARALQPSKGKATAYRWMPIGLGEASEAKAEIKPAPTAAAPPGRKCFSFDGRQFCQ